MAKLPVGTIGNITDKIKKWVGRNNPVHVQFGSKGFDTDEISGRTFLVNVTGQQGDVNEVEEQNDDLSLKIHGDKHCAITSKPLIIGGNRFYFTRDGFVGTMAINRHTLLDGDVYRPSKGVTEVRLDVDDNEEIDKDELRDKLELDEDAEINKTTDEGVKIEFDTDEDWDGDIVSLHGSKKTLYKMNKAKRLRKLLSPQSIGKDRMLAYIGSGVAIGFILSRWLANQ